MEARKEVLAESFQQNLSNKPVGREEIFLQTFILNHVESFSLPTFCGSFWKSWWERLVIPRTIKLSYYLTRWKLHRVQISNGQTDQNYYVYLRQIYLVLKLKFVKSRSYETCITKEVEKEHKEEAKTDEETAAAEEERVAPVPLVTHINNILPSNFFPVKRLHQQSAKIQQSSIVCAQDFHFQRLQRVHLWIHETFEYREGYDYEEFADEITEAPLSERFFTKGMKMLTRPQVFMLYGKLDVDFFSISELLYPIIKRSSNW